MAAAKQWIQASVQACLQFAWERTRARMEMDEFNVSLQHSVFAADSLNGRSGDDE